MTGAKTDTFSINKQAGVAKYNQEDLVQVWWRMSSV